MIWRVIAEGKASWEDAEKYDIYHFLNLNESLAVVRDMGDLSVRPPVEIDEGDKHGAPKGFASIPLTTLASIPGADLHDLPEQ